MANLFFCEINTFYMDVMAYIAENQLIAKNEGAKAVPPFSSPVLPHPPMFVLCFIRSGCRAILAVDLVH